MKSCLAPRKAKGKAHGYSSACLVAERLVSLAVAACSFCSFSSFGGRGDIHPAVDQTPEVNLKIVGIHANSSPQPLLLAVDLSPYDFGIEHHIVGHQGQIDYALTI